ncbi:MAG: tRNA1(Val) (adenine(37)-N6)-methyltransferase [Bacilli bacterium]|nr:tRNA1(Val) (adenine(37)-N6)-methyltransferase [Bacilli bacterium]
MRVKNRLLNFSDNIIYQDEDYFAFSLDSVLLANFVTIKLSDKKIVDLCSGNAPIPMLMSFRTKARIFGVELQKEVYSMGYDSVKENGMDKQIELINDDVKNIENIFQSESVDVVTCNPPYFKYQDNSLVNDNDIKTIARHEVKLTLEDVMKVSKYLLKTGGTLAMVHRPDRIIEIINLMQKYGIEPKRLRIVYPKVGKDANILLIEGIKNGKTGLKLLSPMYTHNDDGSYTKEVRMMFGGNDDVAE